MEAAREELPIWLEAGTEYCRGLYEKLGFELVREIRVGEWKCDGDGNLLVGGSGVRIWGMV